MIIGSILKNIGTKSFHNQIVYKSILGGNCRYYATEIKKPVTTPKPAAAESKDAEPEEEEEEIKVKKVVKEDLRSNQQKILEKFQIPRIIDQADPSYSRIFGSEIRNAKKRLAEKEKNEKTPYTGPFKGQFKLTSAVIIERFPSLEPEPTEYEKEHYEAIERLSEIHDREPLRMINIVEDLPEFKEDTSKQDAAAASGQNADEYEEDFSNYQPEPRVTEDDLKNNRKSLNRHLDKSLYLIIQKQGSRYTWQFPSTNYINGESIKNTAERALRDSTGNNWKYWIPSQAPCGVYKYSVDKELQDLLKVEGIKEFFFRSHYFGGDLQMNTKIVKDHLWVSKSELKEYLDKEYYDQVFPLIYDDSFYSHI
ncbi:hypothetical protein DLAC_11589 [Tieghemostelium lacteum]|uniref:Large ribosomal subunit protein mL46 n=1 Tax=Tieghemostelium lacteum TaxID=361077 RepID=A0A151ZJY4_TIELA|nr:hypothetical protein DLAC_11589 [Tieghemostelium lacteum]|eukprot:KYQ94225.1 hypothetical protein DLAC_11589 [Tieghemostelium lacteum]